MRIGILADIHADTDGLRRAIDLLSRHRADRFVVLGDVFEVGKEVGEAVALLRGVGAVGVWGNHDLGLCVEPDERVRARYAGAVLDFMQALVPRLELGGCLFTHGLPCWEATDPTAYYLGDPPETPAGRAASFGACPQHVCFVGHFHRWLAATPEGCLPWDGRLPLLLDPGRRHLVVVHAVCAGRCALFDTQTKELTPLGEG
jgi:predicted phosphodiesterase